MEEEKNQKDQELYQVVVYNIEGEKNIYNLKKTLFESLNISLEKSQKMLDRGPFSIGKFDQMESEHWLNVLLKLEADAKLLKDSLCPLHPENNASGECSICSTNFCRKCQRKLGLKDICELCAVEFESEKPSAKRNNLPLILIGMSLILVFVFIFLNRSDKKDAVPEKTVKKLETNTADEDSEFLQDEEIQETTAQEETDELGLIFDQDVNITDLGQVGFIVYRSINGAKEQTEFFTEKDMSFNFSILLEIANAENRFEVSFIGPDGKIIKTDEKTTKPGEKEAEFELRKSEIKHAYGNEYVFAGYMATVSMNGQGLGNIPLFYNPSEDFVQNNLPGVPLLTELTPSDFNGLGNQIRGPWIVIFYQQNSALCLRLQQAARILSQNPAFIVKIYQMDADKNPNIIKHFTINDFPATLILIGNRVINIIYGFTNSDEFVQSISVAINRFYGNE